MTNLGSETNGEQISMDNVPNRNVRPTIRGDVAMAPQPQHSSPSAQSHKGTTKKRSPKRLVKPAVIVLAILLLLATAWFAYNRMAGAATIDSSKYQAVFFTNGQVYFGKLSTVNGDYMRLKNVYYLQNKTEATNETSPQSASAQNASDVELIKLGNEIHGPEDEMLISKDQVLFFENLKPAGTVSQTITNFQKTKQ